MGRYLVPLIVFIVVAGFLFVGLGLNPREVPSPFINKPAPEFTLQKLHEPETTFSSKEMLGKVWILNVWASWCVACRSEHPLLVQLGRSKLVPLYGLNYKDVPSEAKNWLRQLGDAYEASLIDYEVIPVHIDGDGHVQVADPQEYEGILERFEQLSEKLK